MDDPQVAAAARLIEALSHLETALVLLDDVDAPADIGAHVDLAICRLKGTLPEGTNAAAEAKKPSARN